MEPEVHRPPPTASVAEARQWEDKIRTTQREVALVMDVIRADIGRMQERGGRLDSLAERASVLDTSSHEFQRCANAVQQKAEQETSVTSLLMVVVVTLCIVFMFSVSIHMSCEHSALFHVSYPIFSGLSFLAVNMMFKRISGGLFNPGTTLFVSMIGRLNSILMFPYIVVQIFGAILGSILFSLLVSDQIFTDYALGSKLVITSEGQPYITRLQGFVLETVLSILVMLPYKEFENENGNDLSHSILVSGTWTSAQFVSNKWTGLSANFALQLSSGLIYNLFLGTTDQIEFIYLNIIALMAAAIISYALVSLMKSSSEGDNNYREPEGRNGTEK